MHEITSFAVSTNDQEAARDLVRAREDAAYRARNGCRSCCYAKGTSADLAHRGCGDGTFAVSVISNALPLGTEKLE